MRGTPGGETPVSQAATDDYREGHDRVFGERPQNSRGRWIYDPELGRCVRAEDYRPPELARNAAIIADRIHEGTTLDVGDRVVDLGSRRKRREFMAQTGLTERSDYGANWSERKTNERERILDRRTHEAVEQAKRTLHNRKR